MVDSQLHDNRCIHDLYIGQCGHCLGLKTPDEEEGEWELNEANSD